MWHFRSFPRRLTAILTVLLFISPAFRETVRDLMVQFSDSYEKSAIAFDELIIVSSLEERKYKTTKYADLIFINDKGGLGTVEEILYVLDLIEREPEFEGGKRSLKYAQKCRV